MPERGDVWQVDFGITQKVRPALVISVPYGDTDRALIGVVPHTTATRGSQFEISVPARFLEEGAFLSFLLCSLFVIRRNQTNSPNEPGKFLKSFLSSQRLA